MIENSKIDEIREKADIVTIVSDYVAIKKRGKNYLGLCPFHSEKTASFTVSQEKQLFHCFGCGEGGNVFSFIMKIENIPFKESAHLLAEKLGINLPEFKSQSSEADKNNYKLFEILDCASKYFAAYLDTSESAKEYAKKRGLDAKSIALFNLGFSSSSWDGLFKHLVSKGFIPKDIEKAGLILERDGQKSYYDRFRNRLMFPIADIRNKIVGFGARVIDAGEPKYLNSPDSPVYNKSNILYGLNLSKDAIKSSGQAIIVEGYMDFIACFSNGIKNVAATSGTAFTLNHAKLLKRFTNNFVIVFDSDAAGSAAAARSIEALRDLDINIKIANLSGGKDPDEIIRKDGADKFAAMINSALPEIQYRIDKVVRSSNLSAIEGRSHAIKEISAIISNIKDKIMQKEYIKYACEKIKIDTDSLSSEIKRAGYYGNSYYKGKRELLKRPPAIEIQAERTLIKIALEDLTARNLLKDELKDFDFSCQNHRNIFKILFSDNFDNNNSSHTAICDQLPDESSKKSLSSIVFDENEIIDKEKCLSDCLKALKAKEVKYQMDQIRTLIKEAEKSGEIDKIKSLQIKFSGLFEEIRTL